jgi:predicted permease
MGSSRRSGYESLSVGYLLIAFAISILVAWLVGEWILIIPVMLLMAGVFYIVLGVVMRQGGHDPKRASSSTYYAFWGGTMGILGAMWLFSRKYPGNGVLLVVVFIIWIGVVAMVMSLPRLRQNRA